MHITIQDLSAKNIVFTESRSGQPECICIDGYGERNLIPVYHWSKKIKETLGNAL
jgi:hypothetical protein